MTRDPGRAAPQRSTHSILDRTNKQNLLLLVQLRWLAVTGQILTILFVHFGLKVPLPLYQMGAVVVVLISLNLFSLTLFRQQDYVRKTDLFLELLVDVGALTIQLYYSGGATNPFIALYILQITLAAALLDTRLTWLLVVLTSFCFIFLSVVYQPMELPLLTDVDFRDLRIAGEFFAFVLASVLLVLFFTRINRNLRHGDQMLANLRQQSVEEDHIVRLGLMASGAAHELGTPLATLSVILNDWQHMKVFADAPDLAEELTEMQGQVDRCKQILSGILKSSGEARGEGTLRTTVRAFFTEISAEWCTSRSPAAFRCDIRFEPDEAIISDIALKQTLFNVLDNAYEASPHWVELVVEREADLLVITVSDRGSGFPDDMIEAFGKPYQSTKGRPGRGLGLFLVVNVVRKLGGSVFPANRPGGGASVRVALPIDAISEGSGDGRHD